MSIPVTFHGTVYQVPVQGDQNWGPPLTRYLVALGTYSLTTTGGVFSLSADINFGPTFGLLSPYFTSTSPLPATSGVIRLAKTDTIDWRNNANTGDNVLSVNSSDQLLYNGVQVPTGLSTLPDGQIWIGGVSNMAVPQTLTGDVTVTDAGVTSIGALKITNAQISASAGIVYSKLNLTGSIVNNDINAAANILYSKLVLTNSILNADINSAAAIAYSKLNLVASIVNADIASAAAIAYSKLALTGSIVNADIAAAAAIAYSKLAALTINRVLVSDGSGFVSASTVTTTTLGFLDATSSIQTQLNSKQATGNYITALTGDVTATGPGSVAATLATVNSNVGSFTWANFTVNGKGLITAASSNSTPVTSLTGTANEIIVSSSTGAVTLSTPQAIGTGSSPSFAGLTLSSPLTVPNGGTGDSSLTAYAVLTGGTTSTAPIQSVAGLGTSGQVLTSNGAGALPTFQAVTGSGTVNAGTADQVAFYATSTSAVSGTNAFTVGANGPNGIITGTNTNDNAAAGKVGEYIESVGSFASFTTGTFTDATSISLTAGDWDISAVGMYSKNGATFAVSAFDIELGIGTASGTSVTGTVFGSNYVNNDSILSANFDQIGLAIPPWRASISATTTYYLKAYIQNFTAGAPKINFRLSARRIR